MMSKMVRSKGSMRAYYVRHAVESAVMSSHSGRERVQRVDMHQVVTGYVLFERRRKRKRDRILGRVELQWESLDFHSLGFMLTHGCGGSQVGIASIYSGVVTQPG